MSAFQVGDQVILVKYIDCPLEIEIGTVGTIIDVRSGKYAVSVKFGKYGATDFSEEELEHDPIVDSPLWKALK